MSAGELDRRLTLFSKTEAQDTVGGNVETWSQVGKLWAKEVQARQNEEIVSDSDRNVERRRFKIRWRSGLTSTAYRIEYQGKKYDIKGVSEMGVKEFMFITLESISNLNLG